MRIWNVLSRYGRPALVVLSVTLAIPFLYFLYNNRGNPNIVGLIVATILMGVLVGFLTTITQSLIQSKLAATLETHPTIFLWPIGGLILALVAVLVFTTNSPTSIRHEIPVTYLVDLNKGELADVTARTACYAEVQTLFRQLLDKDKELIEKARNRYPRTHIEGTLLFGELTEYSILPCLFTYAGPIEFEYARVGGTATRWLGFPDKSIDTTRVQKEVLREKFGENRFARLESMPGFRKGELVLPAKMKFRVDKQIVLEDEMVTITITTGPLIGGSGPAFLDEATLVPFTGADRHKFMKYQTAVIYEATFSKWWFGNPAMTHYRAWAEDLAAVLTRNLAWGDPHLRDEMEVIRKAQRRSGSP